MEQKINSRREVFMFYNEILPAVFQHDNGKSYI